MQNCVKYIFTWLLLKFSPFHFLLVNQQISFGFLSGPQIEAERQTQNFGLDKKFQGKNGTFLLARK